MKLRLRTACLAGALVLAALPFASVAQAPAAAPAPGSFTEMENAGRLAAQAWLVLLDRRDWGTAWDSSSQAFRQSVPLGNWMDAVPKVRQPFGPLVERQVVEAIYKTSLPGRPDGQYVTVMFASKFKNQQVQEIVTTVRESDGRWRVTGYAPNPAK